MPLFSRVFRSKDSTLPKSKSKSQLVVQHGQAIAPPKPRFTANWTSKKIDPEEVEELIHACTLELKSRAEALDSPFFLLPFRPETDAGPARTFIRNFYVAGQTNSTHYTGESLRKELVLTEQVVLCSILKWCWSRLPGGVVTWNTYEGFRIGEKDSHMARNAFSTFIPLGVSSPARKSIVFDFFDLLAAIAAHAKLNGLGGHKLSRLAGWWAFEHSDDGNGFDGGYRSWSTAADASSHLFLAYLRSLEPESMDGFTGINALPRSLKALLKQTDYPPKTSTLMQERTPRVVMLVDKVSPGPFALLRRAKRFEYRDEELQAFSEYDDPVQALTEECKRVLDCIASANQSTAARSHSRMQLGLEGLGAQPDESWSRFQDFGFSDFSNPAQYGATSSTKEGRVLSAPQTRTTKMGRPTTPSWADFLNSGFVDEAKQPATNALSLLPPDKALPPLVNSSSKSVNAADDDDLEPGELASIMSFELDDTFWWVWMTSLASEEPSERKAAFGRCALIETKLFGGRWLVLEEQIKGASAEPEAGAYIAEKKSRFGFSRRNRTGRKGSSIKQAVPEPTEVAPPQSKLSMPLEQQARIRNAAAALAMQSKGQAGKPATQRRGRNGEAASLKTNSMLTLGFTNDASPAMKWARDFDRKATRKQYLGSDFGSNKAASDADVNDLSNRDLPAVPDPEPESRASFSSLAPSSPSVPSFTPMTRTASVASINSSSPAFAAARAAAATHAQTWPPNSAGSIQSNVTAIPAAVSAPAPAPAHEAREGVAESQPRAAPDVTFESVPEVKPVSAHVSKPEITPMPETIPEPASEANDPEPVSPVASVERNPVSTSPVASAKRNPVSTSPVVSSPRKPVATSSVPSADKKPVPRTAPRLNNILEHPAFRNKTQNTTAAQSAAKQAWGMDSEAVGSQKRAPQAGGFRRMFGLKKVEKDKAPSSTLSAVKSPSETNVGRRASLLRKKSPTEVQQQAAPAPFVARAEPWTGTPTSPKNYTTEHERNISIETNEYEDAERAFSSFDHPPTQREAAVYVPAHSAGYPDAPVSPIVEAQHSFADDDLDEESDRDEFPIETRDYDDVAANPVSFNDRWAHIKKNAAERVARMSEEHGRRASEDVMSDGGRTEDDGETSGEESIEARVARIKARVAQLTGGMDTSRA